MTDNLFHLIEGAVGVTIKNGIYRQIKLYRRNGSIFVQHAGGFARIINPQGDSSHPDLRLDHIDVGDSDLQIGCDELGRLVVGDKVRKSLADARSNLLLTDDSKGGK